MKNFIIICLAIFFVSAVNGQYLAWTRTYGGTGNDVGKSVFQTPASGYIICGYTNSFGAGAHDIWLIRTDPLGDTLWTKTYGGSLNDSAEKMEKTSDGGYIIIGTTESRGAGKSDIWLLKIDSLSDTLWTRTYGDTGREMGNAVQQTADGGYIIAGCIYPDTFDYYQKLWLIKTDSTGDTMWTRIYSAGYGIIGNSIFQTPDLGYMVGGLEGGQLFFLKTDSIGDSVWMSETGASMFDGFAGYCVKSTPDGGYIEVGCNDYWNSPKETRMFCSKIDSTGTGQYWNVFFSTLGIESGAKAFYVEVNPDTTYVITGITVQSDGQLGLLKIDSLVDFPGVSSWERTYGGTGEECGYWVKRTFDGGYIITGYTTSFGAGGQDVYLIKTDGNGNAAIEENSKFQIKNSKLKIIKNKIYLEIADARNVELEVFDLCGRLKETIYSGTLSAGDYTFTPNIKTSGIYFVNFKSGKYKETKKLVLMR